MIDQPPAGPHTHQPGSIGRTMGLVMLALVPATAYGFAVFGWPAINLFVVTVASALLFEVLSLWIRGKPARRFVMDGSAMLTGWLLALSLPPWAPWWIGLIGGLLAIVIGKQVFGGVGQNLFNPAMVARVALLIAFPLEMTAFVGPQRLLAPDSPDFVEGLAISFGTSGAPYDGVTGASVLGQVRNAVAHGEELGPVLAKGYDAAALLIGAVPGSLGETSALLLLLGGLFLLYKRVISWHIPVSLLATLFALASLMNLLDGTSYPNGVYHVLAGSTLLGAFFIATDLVTSPITARGQLIFGAGIGLLVYVIRTWAGYPEGMAFAVLLMNACTPLIDHYVKPRIFGRDRKGEPLVFAEDEAKQTS
jgi:electron transport complex protein RnfD